MKIQKNYFTTYLMPSIFKFYLYGGRIVYINQIYADFFGMKKQDIIGMKIEELIPNTKLYEALQTGEAKYDQLFETVDDRKVLYNCLPIKNEYGEILGVATASSLNTALQIENLQERIERLEESNILLNRQLHGFNQAPEIFESIIGISDKIIELKKFCPESVIHRHPFF